MLTDLEKLARDAAGPFVGEGCDEEEVIEHLLLYFHQVRRQVQEETFARCEDIAATNSVVHGDWIARAIHKAAEEAKRG